LIHKYSEPSKRKFEKNSFSTNKLKTFKSQNVKNVLKTLLANMFNTLDG